MERRLRKLFKRIAKGQTIVVPPGPLEIPRCEHGHILLGCPHDDCPQQNAYLDEIAAAMKDYEDRLWDLRREQQ